MESRRPRDPPLPDPATAESHHHIAHQERTTQNRHSKTSLLSDSFPDNSTFTLQGSHRLCTKDFHEFAMTVSGFFMTVSLSAQILHSRHFAEKLVKCGLSERMFNFLMLAKKEKEAQIW